MNDKDDYPLQVLMAIPSVVVDDAETIVEKFLFTEDPMELFRKKNYRVEVT